jgi:hypothetical protein
MLLFLTVIRTFRDTGKAFLTTLSLIPSPVATSGRRIWIISWRELKINVPLHPEIKKKQKIKG